MISMERAITKTEDSARQKLHIAPSSPWRMCEWRDIWTYRELLYFLTWRDIIVRYKQSLLGFAWVIIQPIFNMIVFTMIFGKLAHLPAEGKPYALYLFCALLPWQLFSGSLSRVGISLINNADLLTKVYFPRLIIPLSSTLAGLVDFTMSAFVLLALFLWFIVGKGFSFPFSWPVLTLPFFIVFALFTALAVGLWLAGFNARFRDIGQAMPFLIQIWMYLSPVVYSDTQLIPKGKWYLLYSLNPMVSVIHGFRWALLGATPPDLRALCLSILLVVGIFISGMLVFNATQRTFADVI